jgi:hypothetical protein
VNSGRVYRLRGAHRSHLQQQRRQGAAVFDPAHPTAGWGLPPIQPPPARQPSGRDPTTAARGALPVHFRSTSGERDPNGGGGDDVKKESGAAETAGAVSSATQGKSSATRRATFTPNPSHVRCGEWARGSFTEMAPLKALVVRRDILSPTCALSHRFQLLMKLLGMLVSDT